MNQELLEAQMALYINQLLLERAEITRDMYLRARGVLTQRILTLEGQLCLPGQEKSCILPCKDVMQ